MNAREPTTPLLAKAIYGAQFNPLLALKALAYLDDPALTELSAELRRDLIAAIKATDPQRLPALSAVVRKSESA